MPGCVGVHADYGNVWFPRSVEPGWLPIMTVIGLTSSLGDTPGVDDQRWGFCPVHYGRWIRSGAGLGAVSAAGIRRGVRASGLYAPALVAWVGVGAGVAWFALDHGRSTSPPIR